MKEHSDKMIREPGETRGVATDMAATFASNFAEGAGLSAGAVAVGKVVSTVQNLGKPKPESQIHVPPSYNRRED